jgi:Ca2+-transporting ATPase
MAFLTMSFAEIFHSFNMRSQRKSLFSMKKQNVALWIAGIASILATTLVCEVSFLANAFGFEAVSFVEYLYAFGIGFLVVPIVEIVKLFQRIAKK